MRFASLGSGSDGNGLIVEVQGRDRERPWRLMVDCGFGPRQTEMRLARLGLVPTDLDAILVTHEHGDHIGGVFSFARRHGIEVHASHGTLQTVMRARFDTVRVSVCSSHARFAIGAIGVHPFPVPHDAREPMQFVFDDCRHRLGVLTDVGRTTPHIVDSLSGCDALVMECNHDVDLLEASDYHHRLKRRIRGAWGHLSNEEAAEIVESLDRSRLRRLVAAHLSKQNNTPDHAKAAMARATGWTPERVDVARQDLGFDWIDLDAPDDPPIADEKKAG